MTSLSPKAIVITAYSGAHDMIKMSPRKPEFSLLDPVDFDSDDSTCSGAPKKRRRLTHLSPDEKLLRRKLKNRVAAQTARDRKKALMTELEERVAKLEEENKLLKRQNVSLKEASSNLMKENAELKSRLSDDPQTTIKTETDTSRSAAPAVPLQKEQVQILSRWMAQYLAFMITLSLVISSASCKSLPRMPNVNNRKRKQLHPSRRVSQEDAEGKDPSSPECPAPPLLWWGSHQRSWNPSTN
ncbi:X-box-binding protein 1-like [Plakobranchus ocellatus]|uniref:X-box-binding protein 1 n=1 Tax=Plakobranchus ocellatus TaxID=259542 RepID=A0AAV4AKT3_9GAST|nr:X-box-binding protein 1-like [Plakobranchus ocellatus]